MKATRNENDTTYPTPTLAAPSVAIDRAFCFGDHSYLGSDTYSGDAFDHLSIAFSPETLRDLEADMRRRVPEATPFFRGTTPDIEGLTRFIDQQTKNEEETPKAGEGIQLRYMVTVIGPATIVATDAQGEILVSSPRKAFPPGKPLETFLNEQERNLVNVARQGEYKAEWSGTRVIGAAPLMRDGRLLGVAFIRTEEFYSGWRTVLNFFSALATLLIWIGGASAIVGGIAGSIIARSVTHRLREISGAADSWASGDLRAIAPEKPADELGLLAQRLNQMAGELQEVISLRNDVAALEERQRITRDLHDTIKQEAFATAMMVGSARQCLETGNDAGLRRALSEAYDLSRQMQTDLSSILMQLRADASPVLTERLETVAAAWRRRSGVLVRWRARCNVEGIAPAIVEQVARIAEEAVANAVKHSGGQRVTLTLDRDGDAYRLIIADDGAGFDPATVREGMGLGTMRERAALLPGGRLKIARGKGGGTQVTLLFWALGAEGGP